jgi:hypothetical protein
MLFCGKEGLFFHFVNNRDDDFFTFLQLKKRVTEIKNCGKNQFFTTNFPVFAPFFSNEIR